MIISFKHSNGTNLIHHIDKVSPFEAITGSTKRVVVFPKNHKEEMRENGTSFGICQGNIW